MPQNPKQLQERFQNRKHFTTQNQMSLNPMQSNASNGTVGRGSLGRMVKDPTTNTYTTQPLFQKSNSANEMTGDIPSVNKILSSPIQNSMDAPAMNTGIVPPSMSSMTDQNVSMNNGRIYGNQQDNNWAPPRENIMQNYGRELGARRQNLALLKQYQDTGDTDFYRKFLYGR